MHAIEKILAKNAGVPFVKTGEIVTAKVDFAEINDLYLQTVYSFYEMGGDKVWDKSRVAFCFDHYAPSPTIKTASNHNEMREFARKNDLTYHFDVDCGVCHQVMAEAGVVYPGMILVATDSHTTTHGAFGGLGTGCGATDMACILMTGEMWFRVPEIIEIRLEGQPQKGVYPKDVILTVLGKIKADGAVYKCIDFTGSYVDSLGVSGRMTICNMAVEMGAKTAYMQPNQAVLDYVAARAVRPYEIVCSYKLNTGSVHLLIIIYRAVGHSCTAKQSNSSHIGSALQCLLHGGRHARDLNRRTHAFALCYLHYLLLKIGR